MTGFTFEKWEWVSQVHMQPETQTKSSGTTDLAELRSVIILTFESSTCFSFRLR